MLRRGPPRAWCHGPSTGPTRRRLAQTTGARPTRRRRAAELVAVGADRRPPARRCRRSLRAPRARPSCAPIALIVTAPRTTGPPNCSIASTDPRTGPHAAIRHARSHLGELRSHQSIGAGLSAPAGRFFECGEAWKCPRESNGSDDSARSEANLPDAPLLRPPPETLSQVRRAFPPRGPRRDAGGPFPRVTASWDNADRHHAPQALWQTGIARNARRRDDCVCELIGSPVACAAEWDVVPLLVCLRHAGTRIGIEADVQPRSLGIALSKSQQPRPQPRRMDPRVAEAAGLQLPLLGFRPQRWDSGGRQLGGRTHWPTSPLGCGVVCREPCVSDVRMVPGRARHGALARQDNYPRHGDERRVASAPAGHAVS